MKASLWVLLLDLCLMSCSFSSFSSTKEHLVYDEEIVAQLPDYQPFGGDSFSFVVFDREFDLYKLAEESVSHIKKDGENIEYDKASQAYRIFRSKNSWTLNRLNEKQGKFIPIAFIASCRKTFGTETILCTFKKNLNGKGYQYTLDNANTHLADEILKVLPRLSGNNR